MGEQRHAPAWVLLHQARDQGVAAFLHLRQALAVRAGMAEHCPVGNALADLGGGDALLVLGTGSFCVLGSEREQRTLLRWNAPVPHP